MKKASEHTTRFTRRDAIAFQVLEGIPEEKLWKFVICQAIEDATTPSKRKRRRCSKAEAVNWLQGGNEDFNYVCLMAGFNPERLKKNVAGLIEHSYH